MTGTRTVSVWRQPVSWIAGFVLALHTILVGMSGMPAVAISGGDAGFEICHTGTDTDADRGTPDRHASGEHCKGCFAGGTAFVPPAPVAMLWSFAVARRIAHATPSEQPATPELYREQARGPPAKT